MPTKRPVDQDWVRDELARLSPPDFLRVVGDVVVVQPMPAPLRRAIKAVLDSAWQAPEADPTGGPPLGAGPVNTAAGVAGDPSDGDIEAQARVSILGQEMLNAEQIADLTGSRDANRRNKASRLRRKADIVGLDVAGRTMYPAFQFDRRSGSVRPLVAQINHLLDAAGDPWGVASWWVEPLAWLPEGVSPAQAVLAGEYTDVLLRSAQERAGVEPAGRGEQEATAAGLPGHAANRAPSAREAVVAGPHRRLRRYGP